MSDRIQSIKVEDLEEKVRESTNKAEMVHISSNKSGISTEQTTNKFFFTVDDEQIEIITNNTDYMVNLEEIKDFYIMDQSIIFRFNQYEKMKITPLKNS